VLEVSSKRIGLHKTGKNVKEEKEEEHRRRKKGRRLQ
jgi:hypothetical protein